MTHDRDDCPRRHNAEPPGSHPECICRCAVDRCREPRHGTDTCFCSQHASEGVDHKTDSQVVDEMDDVEMMRRPHLWPLVLVLPLKRSRDGGLPEPALLYDPRATFDGAYIVDEGMTPYGAAFGETVQRTYASPEEITADGWRVD